MPNAAEFGDKGLEAGLDMKKAPVSPLKVLDESDDAMREETAAKALAAIEG